MATNTPRINLVKPDGTDLVDIAVINSNYDKIDANIASTKIQATKPASANAGDLWWDSNTGTLYLYYTDANSSQWVAATSDPVNIGVVANQSERDAQYPTPGQGMSVYRTDLGAVQRYYGLFNASTNPGGKTVAGWYTDGQQYIVGSAAERNARFPAPIQGDTVFRSDLGLNETYYALYNATTNPGGATPAGWYPEKAVGIVYKKNTTLALTPGIYNNISATGNWDAVFGTPNVGAYSNGWTIPFAGVWKVSHSIQGTPAAQIYQGWRVNNTSAPGSWSQTIGGIALDPSTNSGANSILRSFNAGDVLTLFTYTSGAGNWPTEGTVNAGAWQIEFVAPSK